MERPPGRLRKVRAQLAYLRILFAEFRPTLALVTALLAVGSLLFHIFQVDAATGQKPDYFDSLYRTFVLMSMNFPDSFPTHPVLRVWCFAVPLLSFVLVSEAVVRLVVLLSSKASAGRRWVKAMTAVYQDHVILCGAGRLGGSILGELHKMGKDIVVVDKDESALGLSLARSMDVPVVVEDARNERVLRDVGIEKAQAVIAATDNDLTNLEIALDARALKPGIRVVVRMFDQQIAEKIARAFDIKLIFSTSAIAAPSFAAATIDRTLVNSFYIDDKQLQTVKIRVAAGSALIGRSLGDVRGNRQLSILSHRRHNQEARLFPPEETVLRENDRVAVLAQSSVIGQLHEMNRSRLPAPPGTDQ